MAICRRLLRQLQRCKLKPRSAVHHSASTSPRPRDTRRETLIRSIAKHFLLLSGKFLIGQNSIFFQRCQFLQQAICSASRFVNSKRPWLRLGMRSAQEIGREPVLLPALQMPTVHRPVLGVPRAQAHAQPHAAPITEPAFPSFPAAVCITSTSFLLIGEADDPHLCFLGQSRLQSLCCRIILGNIDGMDIELDQGHTIFGSLCLERLFQTVGQSLKLSRNLKHSMFCLMMRFAISVFMRVINTPRKYSASVSTSN